MADSDGPTKNPPQNVHPQPKDLPAAPPAPTETPFEAPTMRRVIGKRGFPDDRKPRT
jgi:hypothetical protein